MRRGKKKLWYVDLLTEKGWKKIPRNPRKTRRILLFCLGLLLLTFSFLLPFSYTYSSYSSNANSTSNISIAPWKFKINAVTDKEISIDLADTITENDYSMTSVIPGTKGEIPLEIDFSGTKVAVDYMISLNQEEVVLPEHLKLYTDSSRTEEFQDIHGSILLDQIDQSVLKTIYWEWEYTTDDETNLWANKEIKLGLTIDLAQKIA